MFSSQNSQASSDVNYIEDVFSTYLYTGNGSTQTITNNIDLAGKGGLVWAKDRTSANSNWLYDTLRGVNASISSNLTNAQGSVSGVNAFNANGFGIGTNGALNTSNNSYVSWTFRDQSKFFDVVTYTGTGANRTIAHNLGSVPGCIIIKRTDAIEDWQVYHRSLANTQYMVLSETFAALTGATKWNSTTPTNTVFSLGTSTGVNASGGSFVAYLFAHNAGGFGLTGTDNVISCGSFTTDGTGAAGNITLGYEAQWLLIKRSDNVGGWNIIDTMRGSSLTSYKYLSPNTSGVESSSTSAGQGIFPTATGFFVGTNFPAASANYIYIAIRRPMKVPTLGTSVFNVGTDGSKGPITVFPPDFGFLGAKTSTDRYYVGSRLTGSGYLNSVDTTVESSQANLIWDRMDGAWNSNIVAGYRFWGFRRAPGFFDVVCYTGTGSATTQAHNLAVVPELIIIKKRNSATNSGWLVGRYISASLVQDGVGLNVPDAFPSARAWSSSNFNSAPTSTVFGIGGYGVINASADTYIAYLFATVVGVSKVGSYTGTGALQTVDCGFTSGARFVLIKRTDSTGDWYVWDSTRGITSGNDPYLLLNSNAADVTTTNYVDTDITGFKVTAAAPAALNASGGTYLFLAIA